MREAIDGYAPKLADFTVETYGPTATDEAWLEFSLGDGTQFEPGEPEAGLFFPWFFHRWAPDEIRGNTLRDPTLRGVPPSRAFLSRKRHQIQPLLQRYLEACLEAPFGFFEIIEIVPEVGFVARDVFTSNEFQVRERAASSQLTLNDIVFGQVVQLQGFAMMEATAPFAFPPVFKTYLMQVRDQKELRTDRDLAMRGLYRQLAESYLNPRPPEIHNTDGDVVEPRTLYFDVESPHLAFDTLKSLALGMSAEELLADATLDADGKVAQASIPWIRKASPDHPAMETVVMGHLQIKDRKLTVEVNSLERARVAKAEIARLLGAGARYRRTRKQPLEAATSSTMSITQDPGVQLFSRDEAQEELMRSPEVRAELEAFQRRHYEAWPDIPLPALQGRTPLEAVKDKDGRELVAALINQLERYGRDVNVGVSAEVIAGLRRRLGL